MTVLLSQVGGRTEMLVTVELPASLSEGEVEELLAMGVPNGWQDTVDRLAARLATGVSRFAGHLTHQDL